jgi:hypothetical protein
MRNRKRKPRKHDPDLDQASEILLTFLQDRVADDGGARLALQAFFVLRAAARSAKTIDQHFKARMAELEEARRAR